VTLGHQGSPTVTLSRRLESRSAVRRARVDIPRRARDDDADDDARTTTNNDG
jgi:hypothetical protein